MRYCCKEHKKKAARRRYYQKHKSKANPQPKAAARDPHSWVRYHLIQENPLKCGLEGCEVSLLGMRANVRYCCHSHKKTASRKRYRNRYPEKNREYARKYKRTGYKAPVRLSSTPCKCGCGEYPRRNRTFVNGHFLSSLCLRPEKTPEQIALRNQKDRIKQIQKRSMQRYISPSSYIRSLWKGAKRRCVESGKKIDIEAIDYLLLNPPTNCPCCEAVIDYNRGSSNSSPSIDRLDNSKGYVLGNVEVICVNCNTIKSVGSAQQHGQIAAFMRSRGLS